MKKILLFALALMVLLNPSAQNISGHLPLLADQEIKLEGFKGLQTYSIAEARFDRTGKFSLNYTAADFGVGVLTSADNAPFFVILSGENIEIVGNALSQPARIEVREGLENRAFAKFATEQPRREQALSAWIYLEQIYSADSLFSSHETPLEAIQAEKDRLREEERAFLSTLPPQSYVRWFLPTRKLVSNVANVAKYQPHEVGTSIAAFRALDYADQRMYRSGLLRDAIESHFWLIENSGQPLDRVQEMMQESIDILVDQLVSHDHLLNEITGFLFDLLERHSLFGASEYLALRLLNETGCTLETDLARQLETYRAMRLGSMAADIAFSGAMLKDGASTAIQPKTLSDLKSKYTLVVFAASWCTACRDLVPQLIAHYPKWQAAGVEPVLIALDDNEADFKQFAQSTPFWSFCDYQKWEGRAVHDYYVFGTPTLFLLDASRKIVLRPNSPQHVDSWIDWQIRP